MTAASRAGSKHLAKDTDHRPDDIRDDALERARKLLRSSGSHEGAHFVAGPPGESDARAIAARLRAAMSQPGVSTSQIGGRDTNLEADAIATDLVTWAGAALSRLENGASPGALTDTESAALEAVLLTRGRPALRVEGDAIEEIDPVNHPGSGFWRTYVNDHEDDIVAVAGATSALVAQITSEGARWVQGSAWLVGGNLAMTNRHVLMPPAGVKIMRRTPGRPIIAESNPRYECFLDFAHDNGPKRSLRYRILDAPFVAEENDPMDVAILRVEPCAGNNGSIAAPLTIAKTEFAATSLYVVGHPGRLTYIPENTAAVFGSPDERKRVSLGEAMAPMRSRPLDLRHDASTIGGYSGGCLLGFGSREVIGLHYFGAAATANLALSAPALRAHPVNAFIDGMF
jgi:hypothetical protein